MTPQAASTRPGARGAGWPGVLALAVAAVAALGSPSASAQAPAATAASGPTRAAATGTAAKADGAAPAKTAKPSGPPSPGPSAAIEAAALQRTHDAALRRLEAAVQDRLDANKGQGRLRWRESVLPPDGDYLVWSPRPARSKKRDETYRIAIEIRTRWFYVARVERGEKPVFLGPLEEGKRGSFSEVLKAQR